MIQNNIKQFIQKHKEDITDSRWDEILKDALWELDAIDINQLFGYFLNAGIYIDPNILFKNFETKFTNLSTMHKDFYNKFTIINFKNFLNIEVSKFDEIAEMTEDYDFKDDSNLQDIDDDTIIKGNKIIFITDANYPELAIELYSDEQCTDNLITYYYYNTEIDSNLVVLDKLGIGVNSSKLISYRNKLISHMSYLLEKSK